MTKFDALMIALLAPVGAVVITALYYGLWILKELIK